MRSLSLKLILAFFATSVAGIVLSALFIRQFVTREFETYVTTQYSASFVADITEYYSMHKSWQGLQLWLRQKYVSREGLPPPPAGGIAPQRNTTPVPGSANSAAASSRVEPLHFALADPTGHIVIPSDEYRVGDTVSADLLVKGRKVTVDGVFLGVVVNPKQGPVLTQSEERYLSSTDFALFTAAAIAVAVAVVLGVVVARRVTRPVRELTAAAQKIAAGDLEQSVQVRSKDELGLLTAQFNSMSRDLNKATQLRRQMTADIAHDLRTPLSVVSGYLEALGNGDLEPTSERFNTLHQEVQSLRKLVEDLHILSLADAGELALERRNLQAEEILAKVAETYRHSAEQKGIQLSVNADREMPARVKVDADRISRVISNLVSNALRYTPSGGAIRLTARRSTEPGWVELVVHDTGSGISPEALPNVFERSYRADSSRQSSNGESGLGLAIAKSLVEAHGGQISVASSPILGTQFVIRLLGA